MVGLLGAAEADPNTPTFPIRGRSEPRRTLSAIPQELGPWWQAAQLFIRWAHAGV